jgi:HYR domain
MRHALMVVAIPTFLVKMSVTLSLHLCNSSFIQDNVGIQHVMASYLPGHYFPEGRHHVLYQATDPDGNRARKHDIPV